MRAQPFCPARARSAPPPQRAAVSPARPASSCTCRATLPRCATGQAGRHPRDHLAVRRRAHRHVKRPP
eukprot:361521-Prymnesium_polylepis.1